MRTLILVVFTVFALSMGYLAYWWMQTPPAARQKAKAGDDKPLAFKTFGHESKYGEGENIWIKKYNEETTKLASRFKADEYKPRNDGWIVVKQPRAQFFMSDGRAIFIEGDTGEIITDDNRTSSKALAGSRDTPSRGRLYNVTIRLFNNIFDPENQMDEAYLNSDDEDRPTPAMTITLNNASFDNQTFKIYSEAYGRGKGRVAADQVPVKLRGDDYDFDGRGLVIRWNERDRRLQLLEVAHGEQLTIKHPSTFMQKEEPTVVLDDSRPVLLEGPLPLMLAAKGHHAAAEAIANPPKPAVPGPTSRRSRGNVPKPKITPNTDPPLYRAIFHDDVKIVQGQDLTATANRMSIDFLMQDQEKQNTPPQPATRPAGHSGKSAKSGATTQPTAAHTDSSGAPRAAETPARTAIAQALPATRPAAPAASDTRRKRKSTSDEEVPVVITWTGKLVVEPLSVGTENPIKNGDAVVRLEGTPVVAQQQGSTIYAGTLTYRTEDQAMLLTPVGAGRPVVMKDTKGSIVETARLDFFQPKHQAILYGASNASFPQIDESGKPGAPLLAKWTKTCTLYFSGGELASNGSMNIERAELDGNVDVTHPQVKIKSDALDLSFDTNKPSSKSATRPATQTITTIVENDQSKLLAVKSSLAQADARLEKLLVPFGKSNIDPLVQSRMAQVEKLESALAQQNKAIKDRTETGQSTPKALLDQVAQAQKEYETAKAGFDLLQQAALEIQDLRSEHTRLSRQVADLQKQLASAKPMARATTQATTRPAVRTDLKQLVATGSVHCEMTDSAKKTQTIDCSRLTLQTSTTPDGKIYPNTVNADGDVHAVDPDQDLRAAHLAVVLRPTTQPSKTAGSGDTANAELQSLIAHKDVVVISKDGTRTMADDLLIDNKDGKNNVKLLGQPYARVIDKKNTLSGPIIEIFPDLQQLQVVGAGNMKGVQQEKAGDPERPINVAWERGMNFDGKTNIVDITGNVVAVSKDAEGATNTASGQHVKMLLADAAPTTRPATQAAGPTTRPVEMALATTRPTSQPTSRPSRSGQYGAMASKSVRQINFEDDAKVNSVTLADDGSLLRRTHLEAAVIEYDLLLKKLLIPVEGRMIVEDHRPTSQPSGSEPRPAAAKVDNNAENNRGTTAFHWPKQFTFDNATHQAVMLGTEREQVIVVHKDDSPKAQTFRLTGDVVTAELEEVASTQPTTKPANGAVAQAATKPAAPATKTQLSRVTANGHLLFTGPGAEVHAIYMEYDPHTHWLIARGNENTPVDFSIATQPVGSRRAEELHYNLETGEVQSSKLNLRMGR